MIWAVISGGHLIVHQLLARGAAINAAGSEDGRTALIWAAILQALVSHNANVNAADERGRTALMEAADSGKGG